MLTERYRLVGLLGKGGMGEVYRADDLKLRQPMALKFLPKALADDSRRLHLLHNEVRVARQVSHPNVCRVHDIGDADGEHFISVVTHSRYVIFQMTEVALPRKLFAAIRERIQRFGVPPPVVRRG